MASRHHTQSVIIDIRKQFMRSPFVGHFRFAKWVVCVFKQLMMINHLFLKESCVSLRFLTKRIAGQVMGGGFYSKIINISIKEKEL